MSLLTPDTACLTSARQSSVYELRAAGMPLGLMPGMSYPEFSTQMLPGHGLLLYSDGLLEAHNNQGEMYGQVRIRACLAGS